MEPAEYVEALRAESAAFAAAAETGLMHPVPSCPEWTMRELVEHLGGVQRFWRQIAEQRLDDPERAVAEPVEGDLLEWFREGARRLVDVLGNADPATPVWTWSSQKNMGFIQRRQANEASVHRWDAQAAAGSAGPIDLPLSADGLAEFFEFMLPGQDEPMTGSGETLLFGPIDHDVAWTVQIAADGPQARQGGTDADAVVRGTASDLLLALWRRLPASAVEVHGDAALFRRFLGAVDLN